jgi:hypothetical protein
MLIALDRHGGHVDAVLPDRSEAAVSAILKPVVSKSGALLCMDGDAPLIAFPGSEEIEYELIIASRSEHVHENVLHIQNVNVHMLSDGHQHRHLRQQSGYRQIEVITGLQRRTHPAKTPVPRCDQAA